MHRSVGFAGASVGVTILLTFLICIGDHQRVDASCDKSILPELTYRLSGNNIEWPCQSTRNIYTSTGRYVPRHVIGTRAQIYRDDAIVAFPRYKSGVPITLGRVALRKGSCQAAVAPFPCWSIQEEGNCQALQSVVDVFVDSQEIVWALDVGVVHTLEQPIKRCPPKVVGIDAKSGQVVKVYDLSKIVSAASRLQYLVVDYDEEGKAYIYIADAGTNTILVIDCTLNKQHRIVLPGAVLAGSSKTDVLYIVLVRKSCGTTLLYFTYLGSTRLFAIKTLHLRKGLGSGSVVDMGAKPNGQPVVLLGSDNGASMFLRYKGRSDIYLWNTETCFKSSNFLEVQKGGECRLSTQVLPGQKRFMWTIESNFHDYIANTVGCNGASVVIHPVVRECED